MSFTLVQLHLKGIKSTFLKIVLHSHFLFGSAPLELICKIVFSLCLKGNRAVSINCTFWDFSTSRCSKYIYSKFIEHLAKDNRCVVCLFVWQNLQLANDSSVFCNFQAKKTTDG